MTRPADGPRAERLDDARVQAFLATRRVVVLATLQPDGAPLATPMWFVHGLEALAMISVADTQKVRNLARDGRVSVVAEATTAAGEIQGVIIQGRAESLRDAERRRVMTEQLLEKYHPHLERRWGGRVMPPDRVMFLIVPAAVHSWGIAAV